MDELKLELLTAQDLPQLGALSENAKWDHTPEDWQTTLTAGLVFGHRTATGKVVPSAAIFLYGDQLASIGMVMVQSEYQSKGLGRRLMESCLDCVTSPSMPVVLSSTTQGLPLYFIKPTN